MNISMISAMAKDNVIGKENNLPWAGDLPADMSFFIKNTKGKPVIMGRKTFDSIGRPLPNRINILLTSNKYLEIDGVVVVNSIEEALKVASNHDEVMVIGGTNIYGQFMGLANKLYVTDIEHTVIGGDSVFPEIDESWSESFSEFNAKDDKNKYDYTFRVYEK
jgi:dihydrofolate reductase